MNGSLNTEKEREIVKTKNMKTEGRPATGDRFG
jgi:hypothetical protein